MGSSDKSVDRIPNAQRQGMASGTRRGSRRPVAIMPLLVALLCALAVVVSGCAGNGGQPKSNDAAKAQEASEKAAEETKEAEAASKATAEKVMAEKTAEEKAAAEKAAAEKAAAEKAEAERIAAEKAEAERVAAEKAEAERIEAEHQALRDEAIANGEQVFEGTVFIGNGIETAELLGNLDGLNAGGVGASGDAFRADQEKSSYAILMLDSSQPVYVTGYSQGPTTRNAAFIQLGSNRYSHISNSYTDNGYSNWADYGGARVCVAASRFSVAEGIDIVLEPIAGQSRLLYVVE